MKRMLRNEFHLLLFTVFWLINSSSLLLTVLKAGSLRSEHQHGWVRVLFRVMDSRAFLTRWNGCCYCYLMWLLENLKLQIRLAFLAHIVILSDSSDPGARLGDPFQPSQASAF